MIAIVAQIAVTVLCIVIVASGCKYFDAEDICVLFTGCVAAHFIFSQAPVSSVQAIAIFAGCVIGHFIYKKIFR